MTFEAARASAPPGDAGPTEHPAGPLRATPRTDARDRPLRILFSMRNFWYVRIFESAIQELADRGHTIHILADYGDGKQLAGDWNAAAAAVGEGRPNITFSFAPRDVEDVWVDLRIMARLGLDYLRFLAPEYGDAQVLERRARDRTPPVIVALSGQAVGRSRAGRRLLAALLRLVEGVVPIDGELLAAVESRRPDLVLLTPLVTLGSEQQDVLRAARRLGIPTALCVGSWDHLSSKALIRPMPDRVFVWNERQREEALAFHHVPPRHVDVTGAQCFDVWFDRQPSGDRAAFCRRVGLDPDRPYVMYACSALFEGSPSEAAFVLRWIEALRASESRVLREAGVLVRAHPKRAFEWDHVDVSRLSGVTLWPPRAEAPFNLDQKIEYFDSLYHCAAIVGLNTSALIEGGIIGRPVHTVLLPEFRDNQEGTLHFHYLLDGGLLRATRDLPSHITQLAAAVAAGDPGVHHNRTFVESFVRPCGLTSPATPVFADAVERLGALDCRPESDSIVGRAIRRTLLPLARRTSGTFAQKNARERRRRVEDRAREVERAEKAKAWAAARARKREAREARAAEAERQRQERALARVRERDARRNEKRERLAAIVRERQAAQAREDAEKLAAKQRLREVHLQQKEATRREKEQRNADARMRRARARRRARLGSLLDRLKAAPTNIWRALGFAGRGKSSL